MPRGPAPRRRSIAKPPGRFHHGDLRRALLQAAGQLLEKKGPLGVGLRAAARLAGVSQAAPYRHFADKETMLAALAEAGLRELADRLDAARAAAAGPGAALPAIAEAYVVFAADRPHLFRLMFGPEVADKGRYPGVRDAGLRALQILLDAIAAGQRAGLVRQGKPADLALALWAAAHGAASLMVDGRLEERLAECLGPGELGRKVAAELALGVKPR